MLASSATAAVSLAPLLVGPDDLVSANAGPCRASSSSALTWPDRVFGAHNGVWAVVTVTLRQTAVPEQLRGRVNSVYYTFSMGGFALGSLTGGLLARGFGLTAPFWVAAVAVAIVATLAWCLFTPQQLAAEPAPAACSQTS